MHAKWTCWRGASTRIPSIGDEEPCPTCQPLQHKLSILSALICFSNLKGGDDAVCSFAFLSAGNWEPFLMDISYLGTTAFWLSLFATIKMPDSVILKREEREEDTRTALSCEIHSLYRHRSLRVLCGVRGLLSCFLIVWGLCESGYKGEPI